MKPTLKKYSLFVPLIVICVCLKGFERITYKASTNSVNCGLVITCVCVKEGGEGRAKSTLLKNPLIQCTPHYSFVDLV